MVTHQPDSRLHLTKDLVYLVPHRCVKYYPREVTMCPFQSMLDDGVDQERTNHVCRLITTTMTMVIQYYYGRVRTGAHLPSMP
jgi:hypothetical protein